MYNNNWNILNKKKAKIEPILAAEWGTVEKATNKKMPWETMAAVYGPTAII